MKDFKLSEKFLEEYKDKEVPFGYGDLSYTTYKKIYARKKLDGTLEEWWETCQRVVEGCFNIQKKHCDQLNLEWLPHKAQKSAQRMYDKMFNLLWYPGGRGIWAMGSGIIEAKKTSAALINCAAISTENIHVNFTEPFEFMMDMGMMGQGVGFCTRGAGKVIFKEPKPSNTTITISDDREGWVNCLRLVLEEFQGGPQYIFDFSKIREKGKPLVTMGGVAPGPEPLKLLVKELRELLTPKIGQPIDSVTIVDIMNLIGKTTVMGNIRRSAQIAFGYPDDLAYVNMKDPDVHAKELQHHRWASNNSIFAKIGMDYSKIAYSIRRSGEPGLLYLENAQNFGRMKDGYNPDDGDLTNPCVPGSFTFTTKHGLETLSNITIGEEVWTGKQWSKITDIIPRGIKRLYRYQLSTGVYIDCTSNHKIIQSEERVEIGKANRIDRQQLPPDFEFGEIDKVALLAGIVLGDGSKQKNGGVCAYVHIGSKDQDMLNAIQPYVANICSKTKKLARLKVSWEDLSLDYAVTYEREISRYWKYSLPNQVRSFLRGLYTANGSVIKTSGNPRVTLKTTSKKLALDVVEMLEFLGIRAYITTNKTTDVTFSNGSYTCKESYDVNTTHSALFRDIIGFEHKYKMDKLTCASYKDSNGRQPNISSKTFIGEDEVFDFTVEASEHCVSHKGLLVANCGEVILTSKLGENCNLVDVVVPRHNSPEEFYETLKYAYLYAKTVTLIPSHNQRVNQVVMKNRRIGTSVTGVDQAINKFGRRKFFTEYLDKGYQKLKEHDKIYSEWLGIPKSIRLTTVKPAGNTSALSGATPGIHKAHADKYLRLVRYEKEHPYVEAFKKAGYFVEDDYYDSTACVVYFPIEEKLTGKSKFNTSLREQFQLAADMQYWWSDNAVSCTLTHTKEEAGEIEELLETYEDKLKTVSLLPLTDHKYPQPPYLTVSDEIPESKRYTKGHKIVWSTQEFEEYKNKINSSILKKEIKKIDKAGKSEDSVGEKYCSNDSCEVKIG